jgi:hypothetical protein
MRILVFFVISTALWAVDPTRVLVLVNDNMPAESGTGGMNASLYVAQHYTAMRGIPSGNIFHVRTTSSQSGDYYGEYLASIETPLLAYECEGWDDEGQILYIVSTYGIPLIAAGPPAEYGGPISVDALLSSVYWNQFILTGPIHILPRVCCRCLITRHGHRVRGRCRLKNTLTRRVNTKMFVTSRLDGVSAAASAALVDKAISAEPHLRRTSGTTCWDWQGNRHVTDWQMWIDMRIRDGATLSHSRGFNTFLNRQCPGPLYAGPCGGEEPPIAGVPINYTDTGQQITCPTPVLFAYGWYYYPNTTAYDSYVDGALGSMLISCNGTSLRTRWTNGSCNWTEQMLQAGITGTWGTVSEPYSNYWPAGVDIFNYFSSGYNWGDSWFLSLPRLGWTVYMVGDPLYQGKGLREPPLSGTRPRPGTGAGDCFWQACPSFTQLRLSYAGKITRMRQPLLVSAGESDPENAGAEC